jgi:hypothetical protein
METLTVQGVLRGEHRRWATAARIAAALVIFAVGAMAGRAMPRAVSRDSAPRYLLALHEDSAFVPAQPIAALVNEYGAWAEGLARRGQLVTAEKLSEWEVVLTGAGAGGGATAAPAPGARSTLSGFFLIRAADRAQPQAIALTHPHLRYGGTIEIREVER